MSERCPGVTFVVPVRNGARWLDAVLGAIAAQDDGRPLEILAVDDGSTDGSADILARHAAAGRVRVLAGAGRGAAAAINLAVRQARHPVVCQVDQDVILEPGWMSRVTAVLAETGVAAGQGYYVTPPDGSVWARVAGLDLEERYSRIRGRFIDHVCTGNSAYRTEALRRVDLFDESLGYGYDNDMSYRLGAAGYRLAFCPTARSVHRWRESPRAYLAQQYGVGYGRLEVVARHARRLAGDDVSGPSMIAHAVLMLLALAALGAAAAAAVLDGPWPSFALAALAIGGVLAGERLAAGARAARRFRDPIALWFAPIHLLRDVAWAAAIVVWAARRVLRRPARPSHSMR